VQEYAWEEEGNQGLRWAEDPQRVGLLSLSTLIGNGFVDLYRVVDPLCCFHIYFDYKVIPRKGMKKLGKKLPQNLKKVHKILKIFLFVVSSQVAGSGSVGTVCNIRIQIQRSQ